MTLEAPKATRPQKQNYVRKKVVSNDNIGINACGKDYKWLVLYGTEMLYCATDLG